LTRAGQGGAPIAYKSALVRVQGGTYVVVVLAPGDAGEAEGTGTASEGAELSEREREVVTLIAIGCHTGEIAQELHISGATVRSHVANAMERLDVHTRAHLVWVALKEGLLYPPPTPPQSHVQELPPDGPDLSEREREVVALIAVGHHTEQIAEELRISPATVRAHVRNAMEKLAVHTRAHLVWVALGKGMVDPPATG
jgi:DNA-binding NarL/FixJ family response regulator